MSLPLTFDVVSPSNTVCAIDLDALYPEIKDLEAFNQRWLEFLGSDKNHALAIKRSGNILTYSHKSWLPEFSNGKPSLLLLFGNPAPNSVLHDIYFAYEGRGIEHRFWKVLRELGFTDLHGDDADIKTRFLSPNHKSPFRLGLEVIYTFPSSASAPKWSGVLGMERLFGKNAMAALTVIETARIQAVMSQFLSHDSAVIALQKDAYNAISQNPYSLKLASEGQLKSFYGKVPIYGTPPTRLLYTARMRKVLVDIKEGLLRQTA